ncbi:hypothetical protein LMG26842_02901 [Achromobacter dolens]|uniref:hypothetical protein n=1 Tax=Achromobacter dolens TaxID=1287738 RepID=UPI0014669CD0|nr:hypothetical protein [Achromobacter dolens]CAB3852214.1 hypothetical protein LMG26842_02901 [Achromobacter dolens]
MTVRPTANARILAGRQVDQFRAHGHRISVQRSGGAVGSQMRVVNNGNNSWPFNANGATADYISFESESAIQNAGGAETRPANTAYHPRIHA